MVSTKKEQDKGLAKWNGQIPAYNLRWKFELKTTQWILYIEFSRVRGVSSGDKMKVLSTHLPMNQDSDIFPGEVTWPFSSISVLHHIEEGYDKVSSGTDVMRGLLRWGSFSCGAWFIRKQLYLVQGEKSLVLSCQQVSYVQAQLQKNEV